MDAQDARDNQDRGLLHERLTPAMIGCGIMDVQDCNPAVSGKYPVHPVRPCEKNLLMFDFKPVSSHQAQGCFREKKQPIVQEDEPPMETKYDGYSSMTSGARMFLQFRALRGTRILPGKPKQAGKHNGCPYVVGFSVGWPCASGPLFLTPERPID